MPKFIINYNGEYEIIEAPTRATAEQVAYERWLDGADQDYGCEEYTKALVKEYGLEEEDDE